MADMITKYGICVWNIEEFKKYIWYVKIWHLCNWGSSWEFYVKHGQRHISCFAESDS